MLSSINPQHLKTAQMVAPLLLIQVLNKIDFTDETNLLMARVLYGLMQVSLAAFWGYQYYKLNATPAKTEKQGAEMVGVPAKVVMGQEQEPAKRLTLRDYDLQALQAEIKKIGTGSLIVCGIHYKWAVVMPLCIQVCLLPLNLLQSPLFQSYGLGKEVPRPFAEEAPLGGMLDELTGAKEEAAVEDKAEAKAESEVSTEAEEKEEEKPKVVESKKQK